VKGRGDLEVTLSMKRKTGLHLQYLTSLSVYLFLSVTIARLNYPASATVSALSTSYT